MLSVFWEHLSIHILPLIGSILLSVAFIFLGFITKKKRLIKCVSILVLLFSVGIIIYRFRILNEDYMSLISLNFSDIALFLTFIGVLFSINFLFQITYYWQFFVLLSLINYIIYTPLNSLVSISYIVSHIYILFVAVFTIVHLKQKPSYPGYMFSILSVVLFTIILYFLNSYLGTNFSYINYPPDIEALVFLQKWSLDTWPRYLFVAFGIIIIILKLMHLPFKNSKKYKKIHLK